MNNSYIAQGNDSKWKITPLDLGGGDVQQMQIKAKV